MLKRFSIVFLFTRHHEKTIPIFYKTVADDHPVENSLTVRVGDGVLIKHFLTKGGLRFSSICCSISQSFQHIQVFKANQENTKYSYILLLLTIFGVVQRL